MRIEDCYDGMLRGENWGRKKIVLRFRVDRE